MMNMMMFGEPSLARRGSGQAGEDSATVLPIIPGNADPGLYSFNDIDLLLFLEIIRDCVRRTLLTLDYYIMLGDLILEA